jgi:Zn-dependent protease with chaperone function
MTAVAGRETFYHAQRRHRRSARLRAIPATLAAAAMGIPLGVYLSPVLLALGIIVTDLINLIVPAPDVGGAVWDLLDRLIDGDPGTIEAIAWIAVIWVIPGIVLLVVAYLAVAWRLRRIGGDGIALGMGARPARTGDPAEDRLTDIVDELAIAAGIEPPRLLLYDDGPPNALVFGRDPHHATVLVGRSLLDALDREETQGVVARLIASAVDGDLGLAVDIAAVYVTYGLLTTTLSGFVSASARARWRAAVRALAGRSADPQAAAAGAAALLGQPADDDTPDTTANGCLTLITMGGFIGVGVSLINLFLSGPLLTFAWRARGYLADATAVDLTRDADGLARALSELGDRGQGVSGTAWLELLLVVDGAGGGQVPAGRLPRLSDTGLVTSLAPSTSKRLERLRAMGADAPTPTSRTRLLDPTGRPVHHRLAIFVLILILGPLVALLAVLLVVAVALLVYLVAFAAFVILALVAGPIHDFLRGLAGR